MLDEIRGAVSVLERAARELDAQCLDGHDAAGLVEVVGRGERVCASIKALAARRVDETKVWRVGGHRSAGHWLADKTGQTVGAAARTLETARALDALPETDAAFCSGQLSETQAAEIASAAGADPHAETDLLATAAETSVKGLRDRCRQVRAGAQEDDAAWARRLHVQRRAHEWTDPDGAYRFEARLAPDAGARFSSALNAHADRIFRAARRAGRREPRAAYLADAAVALATEGPCKPVEVRVVADSSAMARGHTQAGERCEITGVGPIPVTTARALLDDAIVSVLVKDGDDITTVSSPKRTIPAKLRRALEARYPTCGVKGCANDRFLQIDHVKPIAEGGPTSIHNTWRICPFHHAQKTLHGWNVTRRSRQLGPDATMRGYSSLEYLRSKSCSQFVPSRQISQRPRIVAPSSSNVPVNRCEKSSGEKSGASLVSDHTRPSNVIAYVRTTPRESK